MKQFSNFEAFAHHLEKSVSSYKERELKTLNFIGKSLAIKAKHAIGHLQTGAGPFNSWKELAESTKSDKERRGYVFNADYNPLFRTGELKDSISHVVFQSKHCVYIGSTSEIALYQEMGTIHIPARSFLGLTMFKEKLFIQKTLGIFLRDLVTGQRMQLRGDYGSI